MNNQYFNNLMDGDSWLRVQTRLRAGIRVLTNKKMRYKADVRKTAKLLWSVCLNIVVA